LVQKKQVHNFGQNLDEIGNFGQMKNNILDKLFLVYLNMLVAQYKISADLQSTLTLYKTNLP